MRGAALFIAAIGIGLSNLLVVLYTTITNVSLQTIAGSLGVSPTQATWTITSYAVAEAITVPLTGWLSKQFGAQRVFIFCYLAFAVVSVLCGLSSSLGMLVAARILLGLVGGPIIPQSQVMLLRIFPREKAAIATVIWAMTTLIGPVLGPILGGTVSESMSWHWAFLLPAGFAAAGGLLALYILRGRPDPTERAPIDIVGFALLIIWVGAFQIMLDEGRNHDWFASTEIRVLAVVAAIGFAAFLIWELTEENPIVDLRVFRHRGFVASSLTYSVGFGSFFSIVVLLPMWLQQHMGYTSTWTGYATGIMGVFSALSAPFISKAAHRFDARAIVCIGLLGLSATTIWRMGFNSQITFGQMALPTLATGPFQVMMLVPVIGLVLASVERHEQTNAAGISNFMRTIAAAFATSLVQTGWMNAARENQTELVNGMTRQSAAIDAMTANGMSQQAATASLTRIVEGQSVMLATLDIFAIIALCFLFTAVLVWFVPNPKTPVNTEEGH